MLKKNFTRKDLSNKIYQNLGFSKNYSSEIIDNFFETLIIGCRMNFHFEHHIFPNIPYYRFKKSIKINKNKDIFRNFYTKTYFSYDF